MILLNTILWLLLALKPKVDPVIVSSKRKTKFVEGKGKLGKLIKTVVRQNVIKFRKS